MYFSPIRFKVYVITNLCSKFHNESKILPTRTFSASVEPETFLMNIGGHFNELVYIFLAWYFQNIRSVLVVTPKVF